MTHREVSFEIRISQSQKKPIPEEIGKMESSRANVSPLKPVLLSDGNNGNFIQVFHRKRAKVRDPNSRFKSLRFLRWSLVKVMIGLQRQDVGESLKMLVYHWMIWNFAWETNVIKTILTIWKWDKHQRVSFKVLHDEIILRFYQMI